MARLVLFDLDNTLLGGDSDYNWGKFMLDKGLVSDKDFALRNDTFYQDYLQGTLDMYAYGAFVLSPLMPFDKEQLNAYHQEFMQDYIMPLVLPKAQALIQDNKNQGDVLVIITATNDFVTAPIAHYLGVEHLIATTAEKKQGRFTGKITGTPCFQEGKISRLHAWLDTQDYSLQGARFYSDSMNDLPLLQAVDYPVAVDPDPKLREYAEQAGWLIISLR